MIETKEVTPEMKTVARSNLLELAKALRDEKMSNVLSKRLLECNFTQIKKPIE
jgi:hypothetical protein